MSGEDANSAISIPLVARWKQGVLSHCASDGANVRRLPDSLKELRRTFPTQT